MALYAFDGTGDRWNPGTRWRNGDIRQLTDSQKHDLLDTIQPEAQTDNDRYLTNVVFFYKEYVRAGLHAEYFPGVGSGAWFETRTGKTLDFIFGGAFGLGALGVVNQAFGRLQKNFKEDDRIIDIVGYSRGAAIARMFADKVFKSYKKLGLSEPPPIRFVGLFDTVASFGNPLNNNELFFQENLPRTVNHAFHAMSRDLHRKGFGLDRAYGGNVLEVWFRGGHGDVGGNSELNGKPNRGRTNISLTFMLKKALAVGIKLRDDFDYPTNPHAPVIVHPIVRSKSPLECEPAGGDSSRQHRQYDVFHYSFFDDHGQHIDADQVSYHLERNQVVVEEPFNECQLSEQRLLQLTPDLADKFPDTQSIYSVLYENPAPTT